MLSQVRICLISKNTSWDTCISSEWLDHTLSQLPAKCVPGKAAGDGSRIWVPGTPLGEQVEFKVLVSAQSSLLQDLGREPMSRFIFFPSMWKKELRFKKETGEK